MNHFTTQLYGAWRKVVVAGEVTNHFVAPHNAPGGRWKAGERIVFGIRYTGDDFAFYAHNLDRVEDIDSSVVEKYVGSSPYLCQLNEYRALRPLRKRTQPGRQPTLSADPKDCRFYCQNAAQPLSLITRRPLLRTHLRHYTWNAYHNAAPIEKTGHFLWVPVQIAREGPYLPHYPQALTVELLEDAIRLFKKLDQTIVFFNGLNAGASVNHIHLQAVHHNQPLALETAALKHLGRHSVLDNYITPGLVFNLEQSAEDIFRWVDKLHQREIPYNLVMIRDGLKTDTMGHRIVLFPRDIDHEIISELPNDRPGAPAFWGKLIITKRKIFCELDFPMLTQAFKKMGLSSDRFADLLEG